MDKVRITCKADDFLPFQQIQDFQGALKSRTQEDVDHLIASIDAHGFSFPIFVWRQPDGCCSCLDGHGRIMALQQLEREGCEIPDLPVVYIDAADEAEARTKLIQINTISGKFTDSGFRDLVKDIPDLDLSEYTYPELDLEKIDLELKVLKQADASIQQSMEANWGEVFGEAEALFGEDGSLSATASPYEPPVPGTILQPELGNEATGGVDGTADGGALEPDELLSPDGEGEESGPKELVVYCPECGKSFLYQYN